MSLIEENLIRNAINNYSLEVLDTVAYKSRELEDIDLPVPSNTLTSEMCEKLLYRLKNEKFAVADYVQRTYMKRLIGALIHFDTIYHHKSKNSYLADVIRVDGNPRKHLSSYR